MADKVLIDRAVVQQALEALENCSSEYGHRCNRCDSEVDEGGKVASALRAALAQAEPVQRKPATGAESCVPSPSFQMNTQAEPVERKPLTEEEIDELSRTMVKGDKSVNWLCRAVERAHGIKEAK